MYSPDDRLVLAILTPSVNSIPTHETRRMSSEIQDTLDSLAATDAPGIALAIGKSGGNISHTASSGVFERGAARPLAWDDPFRAASISKTVTAATAVRLAAEDRWDLDESIAPYLSPGLRQTLLRFENLDSLDGLTPRRLLSHRSGLPDYFFDAAFQARVNREPNRNWSPTELLEAAAEIGTLDFAPGTEFQYGDTGFVVAGLAIQVVTGQTLADAYRSLVFEPLGMSATYLEWHEPPRGSEISHHYDGETDLRARNTSFDWGGGGLVSTAPDLVRFLHGLFEHRLFSDSWLRQVTDCSDAVRWRPDSSARYLRYGLGLGVNVADGEELYGATGVWGGFAYYWPASSIAIAGTVNARGVDRGPPTRSSSQRMESERGGLGAGVLDGNRTLPDQLELVAGSAFAIRPEPILRPRSSRIVCLQITLNSPLSTPVSSNLVCVQGRT